MTAFSTLFSTADILVVDDNPAHTKLLIDLLEGEGYSAVEGLTDPLLAAARVQKKCPDLLLLSLHLTSFNSLELLRLLAKSWVKSAPAVILLAHQIEPAIHQKALQLAVQDFLIKPLQSMEVLQRVHNVLQLQRLRKERIQQAIKLEYLVAERTRELTVLARQDPLTALPTRSVILETIAQLLRERKDLLAFFIALEGLDEIGRLQGYDVMDQAICALSEHVQQLVDVPIQLLGVWSSDKWVVLCESVISEQQAEQISLCLLSAIQTPVQLQQLRVHVRARIGVSGSLAERTPEQIVRMAAVALPAVDGQWQGYDHVLENKLLRQNQLRDALYTAMDKDELHLVYQPKVAVQTGQMHGVEALLRWNSTVFGQVSPAEFIPIAEANGYILNIGQWVIQQAVDTLVRWRAADAVEEGFTIAVNVACAQLMQPDFAEWLIDLVQQSGLPAYALEIEVTETDLMQDMQLAMLQLQRLAAAGLRMAIDDFGTGYSSLAYLKVLPVTVLKIDRTFISEMHVNMQDQRLTSTVIDMARHFQFLTVAEGVEEPAQFKLLRAMGCDLIQGYLFSPPLHEDKVLPLVARGFADHPVFIAQS